MMRDARRDRRRRAHIAGPSAKGQDGEARFLVAGVAGASSAAGSQSGVGIGRSSIDGIPSWAGEVQPSIAVDTPGRFQTYRKQGKVSIKTSWRLGTIEMARPLAAMMLQVFASISWHDLCGSAR